MKFKHMLGGALLVSALFVSFLVTGCATVRTADPPTHNAEATAQIERRLRDIFVAAESKDFPQLESYHLYGPHFTRFSGSSPMRLDAAATRQLEHDALGAIQGLRMQADMLQIEVFGTVGIATFILDYSFDLNGETIHKKDRSTLVFVLDRGEWKIAHEHLSPIQGSEPDGSARGSQPVTSETHSAPSAAGSSQ